MIFSNKLGVLPEEVFESLENDRMIAKGTVADFLTEFFRVGVPPPKLERNKEYNPLQATPILACVQKRAFVFVCALCI